MNFFELSFCVLRNAGILLKKTFSPFSRRFLYTNETISSQFTKIYTIFYYQKNEVEEMKIW
jgi:hypothetical protein